MHLSSTSKKCPFCAEEIHADAKKCKHCGEILDDEIRKQREAVRQPSNPGVAAVLSLIFPGAGQIYRGLILEGLFWFMLCVVGYAIFFLLGILFHILCIVKAYNPKTNLNVKLW